MRKPRTLLLPQTGGTVHQCWRAHNKTFLLKPHEFKSLYLNCLSFALNHESIQNKVQLHAFCIMSNHVHELLSYTGLSENLSNYMRISHSQFGALFNKANKRIGSVAADRPKTPLIQPGALDHQMRVHFYIEANPLRAGIIKSLYQLKDYKYSSYGYYAWGKKTEFTRHLVEPSWYLKLGSTPALRQKRYRLLFNQYVQTHNKRDASFTHALFLGEIGWVLDTQDTFRHAYFLYRVSLLEKRNQRRIASGASPPLSFP